MGDQMDLPSHMRYVEGSLRVSRYRPTSVHYINDWCRIVVAVNSSMRDDARLCLNVFWTSDSKHYRRQSLWDEWHRVSHCPTNWWALLFCLFLHAAFANVLTLLARIKITDEKNLACHYSYLRNFCGIGVWQLSHEIHDTCNSGSQCMTYYLT